MIAHWQFRQFLTELSAHDMIMADNYRFTFYFFTDQMTWLTL